MRGIKMPKKGSKGKSANRAKPPVGDKPAGAVPSSKRPDKHTAHK
jgi:hypothetical protein